MIKKASLWLIASLLLSATSVAQTPAPPPPPGENFSYQAEGRRDPFLNLLVAGMEPRLSSQRPEGVGGLATAELSVRGIVNSRGALVAMVQGPDNRTHIVRQGDKLMDGTIKAVTPEGLIIVQDVTDPLSLVKQREVRRLLRSIEDGKE